MVTRGRAGASEKAGPRGRRCKPRVGKLSVRRSVAMVMRGLEDAPEEAVAGGCGYASGLQEARGERCSARPLSTLVEAVPSPRSRRSSLQPSPKCCSHRPAKGTGVRESLGSPISNGGRGRSPSALVHLFCRQGL